MAEKRTDWKRRCMEAESALQDASKAFDLIPIGPLTAGQVWVPSEVALYLMKKAKDALTEFEARFWHVS